MWLSLLGVVGVAVGAVVLVLAYLILLGSNHALSLKVSVLEEDMKALTRLMNERTEAILESIHSSDASAVDVWEAEQRVIESLVKTAERTATGVEEHRAIMAQILRSLASLQGVTDSSRMLPPGGPAN